MVSPWMCFFGVLVCEGSSFLTPIDQDTPNLIICFQSAHTDVSMNLVQNPGLSWFTLFNGLVEMFPSPPEK